MRQLTAENILGNKNTGFADNLRQILLLLFTEFTQHEIGGIGLFGYSATNPDS